MKKCILNLRSGDGTEFPAVPADVFGPLGVHRAVDSSSGWTVTHIATGLAAARVRTKKTAVAIAKAIVESDVFLGVFEADSPDEFAARRGALSTVDERTLMDLLAKGPADVDPDVHPVVVVPTGEMRAGDLARAVKGRHAVGWLPVIVDGKQRQIHLKMLASAVKLLAPDLKLTLSVQPMRGVVVNREMRDDLRLSAAGVDAVFYLKASEPNEADTDQRGTR